MAVQLKDKSGNDIGPKAPSKVSYLNTSNPQTLVKEKEYTASSNGWVNVYGKGTSPIGTWIQVNGVVVFYQHSSVESHSTFPVKSGQRYAVAWWGDNLTEGGRGPSTQTSEVC